MALLSVEQMPEVLRLLGQLQAELIGHIDRGSPELWATMTAAEGWTVRHQLAHLLHGDRCAYRAINDPGEFRRWIDETTREQRQAGEITARQLPRESVLDELRELARRFPARVASCDPGARVPWFGPSMRLPTFIVARLMEWWAHSYDVADVDGRLPMAYDPARYVAALGIRTRRYSYRQHGLEPGEPLPRILLHDLDGSVLITTGEEQYGAITGAAFDFASVVVRRRHFLDTGLVVQGEEAERWMTIAQAYAGSPGRGREPRESERCRV